MKKARPKGSAKLKTYWAKRDFTKTQEPSGAREVLDAESPEVSAKIAFHVPDEKEKRHGQAIAAASLPNLRK